MVHPRALAALLVGLCTAGCMTSPRDGSSMQSKTDAVAFNGWVPYAPLDVQLQVRNQRTGGWENLGGLVHAGPGTITDAKGVPWFSFGRSVNLPADADYWTRSGSELTIQVKSNSAFVDLSSFEPEPDCGLNPLDDGSAYRSACASPNSPTANVKLACGSENAACCQAHGVSSSSWCSSSSLQCTGNRCRRCAGVTGVSLATQVAQLTGEASINQTVTRAGIHGTDLGSMFEHEGKVYFLFGDTFGDAQWSSSGWRSNTMAYTTDFDASDGISLDGWITQAGQSNYAKELLPGDHANGETKLPSNGFSIDGVMYAWYQSAQGFPNANYARLARSTDDGQTWDYTNGPQWSADGNFVQVAAIREGPYMYFFGIGKGRSGHVELARVHVDHVWYKSYYRFWTGSGWSTSESAAATVLSQPVGELSVMWNEYLGRYLMTYLDDRPPYSIVVRQARSLTGPWDEPAFTLINGDTMPGLYAPFMHPRFVENDGQTVYFLLSQWFFPGQPAPVAADPVNGQYNAFVMKADFQRAACQ